MGTDEPYHPESGEVAGFELCGWKIPSGIRLGSDKHRGTIIKEWPKEVFVCGCIYTLEDIKWQDNGFGWGIYV